MLRISFLVKKSKVQVENIDIFVFAMHQKHNHTGHIYLFIRIELARWKWTAKLEIILGKVYLE